MKKATAIILSLLLTGALLAGCGNSGSGGGSSSPSAPSNGQQGSFRPATPITVVSREDGSGTRGAFVELLGIEEKREDGSKLDRTTLEAVTVNSTAVMMTTVAGDPYAIGYISLGSLNNSVRALAIDGAAPTVENIKNGSYTVSRPFNIATTGTLSDVAQDFINYILSSSGQAVVQENGYIPLDGAGAYSGNKPSGKVVVAGSSSVAPVMEKLAEAYKAENPNAEIEIQQSDSSTGMSATIDGICDIGMASRELKESEIDAGLASTVMAMDGIAVIVNPENPVTALTAQQVQDIYIGQAETWEGIA